MFVGSNKNKHNFKNAEHQIEDWSKAFELKHISFIDQQCSQQS